MGSWQNGVTNCGNDVTADKLTAATRHWLCRQLCRCRKQTAWLGTARHHPSGSNLPSEWVR